VLSASLELPAAAFSPRLVPFKLREKKYCFALKRVLKRVNPSASKNGIISNWKNLQKDVAGIQTKRNTLRHVNAPLNSFHFSGQVVYKVSHSKD